MTLTQSISDLNECHRYFTPDNLHSYIQYLTPTWAAFFNAVQSRVIACDVLYLKFSVIWRVGL
jgi:hypothetical protein